jgi:hypothetical protein
MEDLRSRERALEKQKRQIIERIDSVRRNDEALARELDALLGSQEHASLTESEKSVKSIEADMERLGREAAADFLPLEKTLRKFDYYRSKTSPLPQRQSKLIEGLSSSPMDALLGNDEASIQELLFLVERAIEDSNISAKAGEKHRIKVLHERLNVGLPELKRSYRALAARLEEARSLSGAHSGVRDRKESLGSLMDNNRQKMESLHLSMKKVLAEAEDVKKRMAGSRERMERLILERTGSRVALV